MSKVEQVVYDLRQKETKTHLKSQIPVVCRSFFLRTWIKALNAIGVDPSSELRNLEKVFCPPAIRAHTPTLSNADTSAPHTQAKSQAPRPSMTAPLSSTAVEEAPSLDKVPLTAKVAPLVS